MTRESIAKGFLAYSNWRGWGPAKSWRRRLSAYVVLAPLVFGFAVLGGDHPDWQSVLVAAGIFVLFIFCWTPVALGPFEKLPKSTTRKEST